jgi:hypothetical protein
VATLLIIIDEETRFSASGVTDEHRFYLTIFSYHLKVTDWMKVFKCYLTSSGGATTVVVSSTSITFNAMVRLYEDQCLIHIASELLSGRLSTLFH